MERVLPIPSGCVGGVHPANPLALHEPTLANAVPVGADVSALFCGHLAVMSTCARL